MNTQLPPVQPQHPGRPPEDVDGLLRAFFRAELPRRWPAAPRPRAAGPAPSRWPLLGSRFALAATLASCLVGSLALASFFPSTTPSAPESLGPLISPAPKEFKGTVITPGGNTATFREQERGNKIRIEVELVPMPE